MALQIRAARVSTGGLTDPALGYRARCPASWRRGSEMRSFIPIRGNCRAGVRLRSIFRPLWQLCNISRGADMHRRAAVVTARVEGKAVACRRVAVTSNERSAQFAQITLLLYIPTVDHLKIVTRVGALSLL